MQGIIVTPFSLVFAFLLIVIEAIEPQLLPESTASLKVDGRIVNGSKANAAQFPHLVSLRRAWTFSHFCGGSIISERWIITAGHCMRHGAFDEVLNPSTFHVVAGGVKINDPQVAPRQIRNVEKVFLHPEQDNTFLVNDAALILLKERLLLHTQYVQPILLAAITPPAKTECIVAGWGYLAEMRKTVSNDLMYLKLPLLAKSTCKKLLGKVTLMVDGQICAGYVEGQRDACQGDSGGPLMCNGTLTGLVSGGKGCARPNLPGFYTEIAYYREWIDEVQKRAYSQYGRSSTTVTSASLMSTIIIYSVRSLYVAFY